MSKNDVIFAGELNKGLFLGNPTIFREFSNDSHRGVEHPNFCNNPLKNHQTLPRKTSQESPHFNSPLNQQIASSILPLSRQNHFIRIFRKNFVDIENFFFYKIDENIDIFFVDLSNCSIFL
jgi:hypothetical protein